MANNEEVLMRVQETLLSAIGKNTKMLEDMKTEMSGMRKAIDVNSIEIKKVDGKIETLRKEFHKDRNHMHKLIRQLDQKQSQNGIVIKGFPDNKFDEEEIKQNISTMCEFISGFSECYKFSINIGKDRETNEPRFAHMMVLSLVSMSDKTRLFETLKKQGHFMLRDLSSSCPVDMMETKIWIENRLSRENLQIRKRLLELKNEGLIEGFTMRSGLFLVQQKGADTKFTVFEMIQLDQMFPTEDDGKSTKRNRVQDTPSPVTQPEKILRSNSNATKTSQSLNNDKTNRQPQRNRTNTKQQQYNKY